MSKSKKASKAELARRRARKARQARGHAGFSGDDDGGETYDFDSDIPTGVEGAIMGIGNFLGGLGEMAVVENTKNAAMSAIPMAAGGLGGIAGSLLVTEMVPVLRDQNEYVKGGATIVGGALVGGLALSNAMDMVPAAARSVVQGVVAGVAVGAVMTGLARIGVAAGLFPRLTGVLNLGGRAAALPAAGATAGIGAAYVDGQGQPTLLDGMGAAVAEEYTPQSYALQGLGAYAMPNLDEVVAGTL
jgi:hypothetical protein